MMFSPDKPPFQQRLSPGEKAKMIDRVIKDLQQIISRYESLYLASDERSSLQETPFNKRRFERFQSWIKLISAQRQLPASWRLDQTQLEGAVIKVEGLYRVLLDIVIDKPLASETHDRYFLAPDEFCLWKEDFPTWTKLPAYDNLKKELAFDNIIPEFNEGRNLTDFSLTERDVLSIGYAADDQDKREALLESVDFFKPREAIPPAKILSIDELIKRKKANDPDQPSFVNSLTTQELFEAFDLFDVRPATLLELLTYAKCRWKPEIPLSRSSTLEEEMLRIDAPIVYGFGSAFSNSEGGRSVPAIGFLDNTRWLYRAQLINRLFEGCWFLVFKKESL